MATKEEILAQIQALQDEADQMGEESEFDVEIWNEKGEGARLPHGQTTRWLKTKFPELFDPDPDPNDPDNGSTDDGKTNPPKRGGKPAGKVPAANSGTRQGSTATRYFGKRPAGK